MRVALIHDGFTEYGGAERVLQAFIKLYPGADIFSSYAKTFLLKKFFPGIPSERFHFSLIQKTPLVGHNTLFQIYSPVIWKLFNFESYDLVISNSFYMLCNQIRVIKPFHIQYINYPPKNIFGLTQMRPLQKIIPYTKIIANFYERALRSTSYIISISKYTQKILLDLFGVSSKVIYPPVKIPNKLPEKKNSLYYLCVSRLDRSKSIEIAIEACNRLKLPLKIVGKTNEPKYEFYLRSIAGPTIEFLGMKSDKEIAELYKSAIAFIFTTKNEDFGIAPVEAMAHGVPVIAYFGGGAKETILQRKTGLFFYEHSTNALVKIIRKFSGMSFNPDVLYNHAKKFSEDRFTEEIKTYADAILAKRKLI